MILPTKLPYITALQGQMQQQFSVAWQETLGDQSYFTDLTYVWDGIDVFFSQTTDATIALLDPKGLDQDIIYVFGQVYSNFAQSFSTSHPKVAGVTTDYSVSVPSNFMKEEPLYNIVPESHVTGETWATMQDGMTGQIYCVGIFNSEVNRYLGECKNDYH